MGVVVTEVPTAISHPKRRWSWAWLIPLLALAGGASLFYWGFQEQGTPITILFKEGHGLKVGDRLSYRGIDVGEVRRVELTDDALTIQVMVELTHSAEIIARSGSYFWIERPQINLRNISGLETLIGANYLRVLPSSEGTPQYSFVGLEEPPLESLLEAGGLEIILSAKSIGALQRGAPISYRQVVIGAITEVDLAKDASAVMARAYIQPKYISLIREGTRFWRSSAVSFDAGWLRGISVELASIQTLLDGGVNIAIPEIDSGEKVESGHLFILHEEPEVEWEQWTPYLPLGDLAESNVPEIETLMASLIWEDKRIWTFNARQHVLHALLLPVENGFLGPSNILIPPQNAKENKTFLNIESLQIKLSNQATALENGLAFLETSHNYEPWTLYRVPQAPEDTFVYADSNTHRFIAAHHYEQNEGFWTLDDTTFDSQWHGAVVVSSEDGHALGILLLNNIFKVIFWPVDLPSYLKVI